MRTIDYIIVTTYLILCVLFCLYKSKSIGTLKEYAIGNGSFANIVIISTIFATYIDALSTMGVTEKVYTLGMFYIISRLITPLFWLIMAKIYGHNIAQFNGCISISDIMELLYGKIARWVTNIASIIMSVGYVGVQATALGYISNYFFNISHIYGAIAGTCIIALYSSFGGIRAVALTDVFQLTIFIIAIPIACSFAYHDVGGYNGILDGLPEGMLSLNINQDNVLLFSSLIFFSLIPVSAGCMVQRFLISKNAEQLIDSFYVIAALSIPLALIICLIGLIIKVKVPDIEPNTAFIYFIANYIPAGLKGIIIAGLFAVTMSTADSYLNYTSVLFAHDIAAKLVNLNEKSKISIARFCTIIIAILSIPLAFFAQSIMDLIWIIFNFWEPLILIPLVAGFLKFRTNSKSFISATIIAVSFTALSGYIIGALSTISAVFGMIGSAVGLFGMHYWQVHQGVLNVNTQQTKLTKLNNMGIK